MSATQAITGYNSTIEVETAPGSGTYFELAEVKSIGMPNAKVDQLDATHMKSPNQTREKIPSFTDPGDFPVKMNWVPNSATDAFIVAWNTPPKANRAIRVTTPNGAIFTFSGSVSGYETPLENESVLEATLTVQVAGAVTQA